MHMKVMKNLSRRWWGYFVSSITRKWEVCVHINLQLIFVWDAAAHSASPCSQSNAVHCQLWPCSAQLCAAGEALLLCGSAEAALGNPHLLYPSSSAPALSHRADQQGGAAEDVWQEQHLGPVRSPVCTHSSAWLQTPHLLGMGRVEKLCWRPCHCQVFPKIWTNGLNPTEITVPQARRSEY